MYLFSGKIKCQKCNGRFRGITERGKRKYYCSSYHNYRTCVRMKVVENQLFEILLNHWEIQLIKKGIGLGEGKKGKKRVNILEKVDMQELVAYVKEIIVSPDDNTIELHYQDGTRTFISSNRQIY